MLSFHPEWRHSDLRDNPMSNLAFRSLDRMSQEEFARWVETLPPEDLHHYELLDGFVVMEPPAGWPHGGIGALVVSPEVPVRCRPRW